MMFGFRIRDGRLEFVKGDRVMRACDFPNEGTHHLVAVVEGASVRLYLNGDLQ